MVQTAREEIVVRHQEDILVGQGRSAVAQISKGLQMVLIWIRVSKLKSNQHGSSVDRGSDECVQPVLNGVAHTSVLQLGDTPELIATPRCPGEILGRVSFYELHMVHQLYPFPEKLDHVPDYCSHPQDEKL